MSSLLPSLGFALHHEGGVSRAWLRTSTDGRYLVVTDPGGYDLPDDEGPFLAYEMRPDGPYDDEGTLFESVAHLLAWIAMPSASMNQLRNAPYCGTHLL